jgi:hypothetical protein
MHSADRDNRESSVFGPYEAARDRERPAANETTLDRLERRLRRLNQEASALAETMSPRRGNRTA